MAKQSYLVVRQHLGDKMYMPGDTREAEPSDVAHLVPDVLVKKGSKSEPAPKNKMELPLVNKSDAAAKAK